MTSFFPMVRISKLPILGVLPTTFSAASMRARFISNDCIFWVKFMSFMAMCFAGVFAREASTSKQIFFPSYWLQMIGINTGSVPAQMVNLKVLWNIFFNKNVGEPMGHISSISHHKFAISGAFIHSIKNPALRFRIYPFDSIPKIFKFIELHTTYIQPCVSTVEVKG